MAFVPAVPMSFDATVLSRKKDAMKGGAETVDEEAPGRLSDGAGLPVVCDPHNSREGAR